jgi:NAD(P)-dependent dehydrogenase (short-subunit alcohol dehydrogenase family)
VPRGIRVNGLAPGATRTPISGTVSNWSDPRIAPLDECPNRENHAHRPNTTDFFNSLLGLPPSKSRFQAAPGSSEGHRA